MSESFGYIIEYGKIWVFEIAKENPKTITPASKHARALGDPSQTCYIGSRVVKDAVFRSREAAIDAFRALLTADVEAAKRRLEVAESRLRAFNEGAL